MIMNTFENYLNEPYSLRFEQMQDLHRELLEEIGSDNNAFELYSDLVSIATKYAAIRAGWQQMTREDKMLMYGKEASNRKQEIDRQHHTIPNKRTKDKHYGNVHNRLWNHG